MNDLMPAERIESKIFLLRGQKVMLDYHLAELYGIETKYLKRQVKRNARRFPSDFMFQLTKEENLRCQNVTSNWRSQTVTSKHGGQRYLPFAFTEQGVAMLSSVLNSERAIQVNIAIMRAFVKLKRILSTHKEVSRKLKELEGRIDKHDFKIQAIFDAIHKMINPATKPARKIGFV